MDWLKKLKAAHRYDMSSPKDIHFFRVVLPTESPKIMGLKGIHSPEALQQCSRLTFCPWCGKGGQNGWWLISCGLCTTTWASYAPTASTILLPVQMPCIIMLSSAGLWWLVMTTKRNLPQSMRRMKTVMVTMTSYLRKTRPPCHLHIPSSYGQLHPLHQCPHQGRPNYIQHLTRLSISQCSIMTSCYVINGSHVRNLPLCFILVKRQ